MTAFEAKKAALEGRTFTAPVAQKVYDVYIRIEGIATTDIQVAQFIARLNRSPLFKDVNLVVSEVFVNKQKGADGSSSDEVLRKFQIEMMLNPNAEVMNPVNPNTRTAAVEVDEKSAATGGKSSGGKTATAGTDAREIGK
jgi:hypothetical protein